ncbi:MAG: prenyltransferase [Bacteroidales bacterium]|nr:MAG: prenyltransferase [Bacteroidales bacterium]
MTSISFWIKSLKVIPQVTKEEWGTLDIVSRWLVASRAAVFIMTAISCAIGGLLAYNFTGVFNTTNFLICLVGLVFAHAANNLLNDLIDYNNGIDKDNYYRTLYGPQIVERGYTTKNTFYGYILFALLIAVTCGLFLVLRTDKTTLYLMAAGIIFLLFYTWPLKYIGLGEPTVVLVWGPLMIGGAFYVTSNGLWNWNVLYISLLYAIGPTSVIFGKHIDKSDKDLEKKVYTIPVMLGEKISRYTTLFIWFLQYAVVGYFIYKGVLGLSLLLVLLAIPKYLETIKVFLSPKPTQPDPNRPTTWPLYFASFAFVYNRRFSILFLVGLILDVIISKVV